MAFTFHIGAMRIHLAVFIAFATFPAHSAPPEIFAPGVVSTGHEFTVTFTPDGGEVYFTRSFPAAKRLHVLHSVRRDGVWQPAEPVSFAMDSASDLDPSLSPDGSRLYFVSTRPHPVPPGRSVSNSPDMDIWYVDRIGDHWGVPRWIEALSSDAKEGSPTVDRAGTLCFFSGRGMPANSNAIYCAPRTSDGWGPPNRLNENINAGPSDTSPFLSPDGRTLLFYSERAGGMGKADLYVSVKRDGTWQSAANLGPFVNGPESEYNPSVSPDGRSFYFGRGGNVHVVPLTGLDPGIINSAMFK